MVEESSAAPSHGCDLEPEDPTARASSRTPSSRPSLTNRQSPLEAGETPSFHAPAQLEKQSRRLLQLIELIDFSIRLVRASRSRATRAAGRHAAAEKGNAPVVCFLDVDFDDRAAWASQGSSLHPTDLDVIRLLEPYRSDAVTRAHVSRLLLEPGSAARDRLARELLAFVLNVRHQLVSTRAYVELPDRTLVSVHAGDRHLPRCLDRWLRRPTHGPDLGPRRTQRERSRACLQCYGVRASALNRPHPSRSSKKPK
jgi:hypothetical protein